MNTFKAELKSCSTKTDLNRYLSFGRSEMRSPQGPHPYFVEGFSTLSGLSFFPWAILNRVRCCDERAAGKMRAPVGITNWLNAIRRHRSLALGSTLREERRLNRRLAGRGCEKLRTAAPYVARCARAIRCSPETGDTCLHQPTTVSICPKREDKSMRDLNGPEKQKALLLEFWKRFGGKPNRAAIHNYPTQEKLEVLIEYSRLKIQYDCQIPLKVRRERFNKDKHVIHPFRKFGKCFACGKAARDRHHIIQIQNGGINSKKNLVSLCGECHETIHPELRHSPSYQ